MALSTELPPTRTGRCLCGAVGFTLTAAPEGYAACHCGVCRRWTGGIEPGVMTTESAVHREVAGHVCTRRSSDWAERVFRGACGSSLRWKMVADGPHRGMMSLPAGALDGRDALSLTHEVHIDMKPAGRAFAGARTRMTEAEVLAMAGTAPEGDTP